MGLGTTAALINAMTQKTEKELSRVKTAIQGKADEPTGTKSAGKVYGLDSNLHPVWVEQSGDGGMIPGERISGNPINNETDNLLGSWTDGKYATGKSSSNDYNGLSYATAEIGEYDHVIVSCYTAPSNSSGYPFVFFNINSEAKWVGSETYETVGTKTYKVPVPAGATHISTNVLTAEKEPAVVKGVRSVTQKILSWLTLGEINLSDEFSASLVESIKDGLVVDPTMIDGEKKPFGGNDPSDLTTEAGYYTMKGKGVAPGFTNQFTHFEFTVQPNEIIKVYLGTNVDVITSGIVNTYFCIVDSDGYCVDQIPLEIDSEYVYTLRVPEDGHTCYITQSNSTTAWAKSYFDEFELGWLVLKGANIKHGSIPESAIGKSHARLDSIEKSFDFSGKTVLAFGDSITAGVANEGSGNISAGENSYIRLFCTKVNATLVNKSVGGATIAYRDNESVDSVYTQITETTSSADFIIIAGGTNDYNQGITVGNYGDVTEYTTYGALHLICEYLKVQYPNATVIFITPINVTKDFNRTPKEKIDEYRSAIYETATSYGYNVVNGADLVPVEKQSGWDTEFIHPSDGCHPTLKGHAMYFKNLCMKLL